MSKRNHLSPRYKRMKGQSRLQAAKAWLARYPGKNIVKGYSRHFAVHKLCAVIELQIIGVPIDSSYIEKLKRSLKAVAKAKAEKKQKRQNEDHSECDMDGDQNLEFIAGSIGN